ncbi:MAG: hypothetical protein J0G96_01285 [Flavobacteriia bacterium]|nr:hypothetical protein [Flavobacteriia bacterium]OJX36041.1 MAG: hypothetical protein BGO87_06125 [Flavobacteriia bacterium 40-80]
MAAFKKKEDLLNTISQAFEAINLGNFDLKQMDELVSDTRELYERMLIIRHKAYELKAEKAPVVFENDIDTAVKQPVEPVNSLTEEEVIFTDTAVAVEEPESAIPDISPEVEISETQLQEPDTFSVDEKEEGFAFDLFSEDEPVKEQPVDLPADTLEEEAQEIPEQAVSMPEQLEEDEVELPKAIGDIIQEHAADFTVESIIEEEIEETESTEVEMPAVSSAIDSAFFANYKPIADNPSAKMLAPKIESLSSAFGLNEKLMFIRELFNGSSEAFNQAVSVVDELHSFEEAKLVLNDIALSNDWNLEQQATLDFVNKIERRFF